MIKTFKELLQVDMVVAQLYKQDPKLKDTKFGYAYKKFFQKNIEPTQKSINEEMEDIRIDNALEDEKTKAVILDEKSSTGYAHSKEQWKNINKQIRELSEKYENKEIEVEPYISSYVPEMTDEQAELLTGIII